MRQLKTFCDGCGAGLSFENLRIEIKVGFVGPYRFRFRSETVFFTPSVNAGEASVDLCGVNCLTDYFERKAQQLFKKWVNARNDLAEHEIIGG